MIDLRMLIAESKNKEGKMKRVILGMLTIMVFCSFGMGLKKDKTTSAIIRSLNTTTEERIFEQVARIKELVKTNPKYNNEIAFLLDMRIMSGKNRFFIYDLKNDKVIDQGLVAHGIGSGFYGDLKFSNEDYSYCTSLGNYYIGKSYIGQYGKSYRLHGFEETNNNAFSRNIVLHKYDKVPYEEQNNIICNSLGCPMVNETYYKRIEKLIDASKSNIILDIYY
ncbi:MAG: murein L,D-transpeptidase catalytic domain family protein [Bacteroidota bacterium]